MSLVDTVRSIRPSAKPWLSLGVVTMLIVTLWQPHAVWQTVLFIIGGMISITPVVIPGVVLAAWLTASGAGDRVAAIFQGRTLQTVSAAALVGALIPVCGVTVLPLMAGLLAAGVPLAPVMAFWLASPITGPALLSTTLATLGPAFAIGKTLAAIGLGLFGGLVTALFARRAWTRDPLRDNRLVGSLGGGCGGCSDGTAGFDPKIWRDSARRARFGRECWAIARLMLLVLTPAFAAEYWLNAWLSPDALTPYVGKDNAFAVPIAVFVGGPAYVDGYAALPLTRVLLDHGMSPGAAMAFLISGGVVSIWGALAIFPVLRLPPFLLYLALALTGSMLSGWAFGAFY